MSFSDDDEITNVPAEDFSAGENSDTIKAGKTQATVINNPEAPLAEGNFKVMVELTGSGSAVDRPGVDLVTVLDVSESMGKEKLYRMKSAMEFVIRKLSPIDRLSVVTFNNDATRLCRLRQITKRCQAEIRCLVYGLQSCGKTNITAGLETALKVLNERRNTSGQRVVAIMLMSDGAENIRKAAEVDVGNVPVFTFGFGAYHEPRVLTKIALKSAGGTFSDVQNQDDLGIAFSQCLAGLLTVVVQDLELTVKSIKSTIEDVRAGDYQKVIDEGSATVFFGNLYAKEVRKVIVDLLLPEVTSRSAADVLEITYKYRSKDGEDFDAAPILVRVRRTGTTAMQERAETMDEENRLWTAKMMKDARKLADKNKLDDARMKIAVAQNNLEDIDENDTTSNELIDMLRYELSELAQMLTSENMYKKQGRPFALSSETSHDRQRYAARGDVNNLRLFATPRMNEYLDQVQEFEQDPSKPVFTERDDVKRELAADPLAPIAGALSYYIQIAIQALQSIDNIFNRGPG